MRLATVLLIAALVTPSLRAADNSLVSSMDRKLQHIQQNGTLARPDQRPTILTEAETNAYFAAGRVKLPAGVQSVVLHSTPGVITGLSHVDFDRLKQGRNASNPLLSIFSGEHDVQVVADARGAGRVGYVQIQSVSLDGVEVPRVVLQLFIDKYLKPKYPYLGMNSQFALPDKIDIAIVGPHQVTLTQK
jgi:hypothetical protein